MITPDLIEILKEPTEHKQESFVSSDFGFSSPDVVVEAEPIKKAPTPNLEDFEPEPINLDSEEPPKQEIKKEISLTESKKTAEMVVATYDAIQTLTFPFLYQRSIFTKKERQLLKDIKVKMRQSGIASLNEEEQNLFDKYTTYSDLKDNVAFTDNETNLILEPLAKVFKKYNVSLGPEILLLSALATVSLPRFLPLFTPLEKL